MNDHAPQQTQAVIPYGDPRVPAGQVLPPGGPHVPAPEPPRTNRYAIASLVLGIFGGGLLSIILGFVALRRIKWRGEKGRGQAIAGVALGAFWLVVAGVVNVVYVLAGPEEPADRTPLSLLTAGTCVNEVLDPGTGPAAGLPVVPCSEPHEGEVFATFRLSGRSQVDADADADAEQRAAAACERQYAAYTARAGDSIRLMVLRPTGIAQEIDPTVRCVAVDTRGPSTGSLAD